MGEGLWGLWGLSIYLYTYIYIYIYISDETKASEEGSTKSSTQDEMYQRIKEYGDVVERLDRLRTERQRVHQIAASGINCQQPAQEPTLADDRFVLGVIHSAVHHLGTIVHVHALKRARSRTPVTVEAINLIARIVYVQQSKKHRELVHHYQGVAEEQYLSAAHSQSTRPTAKSRQHSAQYESAKPTVYTQSPSPVIISKGRVAAILIRALMLNSHYMYPNACQDS
jgi:hypothetical protein